MFLDRGHPRFRNFNSAIPVDVVRVKSYVDGFLDPTSAPGRVSINKPYLVPKRIMAGLMGVLRSGGGLGMGYSYIPVVLFDSLMQRSLCFPDVDFTTFTENPLNHAILFSRIAVSFKSIVTDLKTVRMPCCSRQRRIGSDTPCTLGKTAVGFELCHGLFPGGCFSLADRLHKGGGISVRDKYS